MDIPLVETPQAVSVVTQQQLDILNVSSLGEVARAHAGHLEILRPERGSEFRLWIPLAPAASPDITEDERRTILELIAKGSYTAITLAAHDLDGVFEKLEASGAEIAQEPIDQPYGVRDCAVRDPAGNLIRIQERS